jgi:hypothetical protein
MIAKISVTLLVLIALYLGYRAIYAFRLYLKFRGPRLLTCPETKELELVEVAAGTMAMEAFAGEPCFRVRKCSRWPMCRDCGQDCLTQIEPHPSEFRLSAAWRTR